MNYSCPDIRLLFDLKLLFLFLSLRFFSVYRSIYTVLWTCILCGIGLLSESNKSNVLPWTIVQVLRIRTRLQLGWHYNLPMYYKNTRRFPWSTGCPQYNTYRSFTWLANGWSTQYMHMYIIQGVYTCMQRIDKLSHDISPNRRIKLLFCLWRLGVTELYTHRSNW